MHKSRSVQRCMNPNPRHSQCTLHANEHTALLIAQCTCSVCVTTDKTLNKNWCVRYDAAPIHKCSVCEARVWSNARLHTAAISKSFGRRRGWDKSQIWPSLELFPASVSIHLEWQTLVYHLPDQCQLGQQMPSHQCSKNQLQTQDNSDTATSTQPRAIHKQLFASIILRINTQVLTHCI